MHQPLYSKKLRKSLYQVCRPRRLYLVLLLLLASCQDALREDPANEVKVFDPQRSHDSFTLIPEEGNATVKVVNHLGHTVHTWKADADRARLLPSCNLLVVHGTKWGTKNKPWKSLRKIVREYSWDGSVVWEHKLPDVAHHDVQRLDDGSTLMLYRSVVPESYQMQIKDSRRRRYKIRGDSVVLVDKKGEEVWSWNAHEHLDLNFEGAGGMSNLTDTDGGRHPMHDWTHINTASLLPENKWSEAGDQRFKPGNLLVHIRNWSRSVILDRETGDPVWEYTGTFEGGVSGGHEAHMIPPHLPGAGNILIFDNGRVTHAEQSLILEVSPPSKEVVWHYSDGKRFYSKTAGSVQRLPNGNTFISQDKGGRLFEVTPAGEIVWEYQNKFETNRSHRYADSYCDKLADLTKRK